MTTTVFVFSLEVWDDVWRRNQYLIDGLLRADKDLRVVFVEPPKDVLHDLVSRRVPRPGRGRRAGDPRYGGRLMLFEPTKWLPRFVGPVSDRLLQHRVERYIRRDRADRVILWINDPDWAQLVARHDLPSLYDMTDDWLAADRTARAHARTEQNEAVLFDRCTAVVACSEGLRASRSGIRPDLLVISNAVDVARYRRPQDRPADLPDGRIALYVGTLHEDRLDVDLVVQTARALAVAGSKLVLVGPNVLQPAVTERLASEPGIVLLGARPHTAVPAYLQHATVLVVPHAVNEFTESLDPIKLYEYLAVGRPVVSTPVAGFRDRAAHGDVVVVDKTDFPAAVVGAIESPPDVPAAEVADWGERIAAFHALLGRLRT